MAFKSTLGIQVDRPNHLVPSATNDPYFTVVGDVLIKGMIGEFTGNPDAAMVAKWEAHPTAGTVVDICAASADLTTCDTGDVISFDGVFANALIVAHKGAVEMMGGTKGVAVTAGTLDFDVAGAVGTAQTAWTLWYIPLTPGAYVVAIP